MSLLRMHNAVAPDGFIADADDQGGPRRYFGSVDAQHLLEDPHVVIQGERVLHLQYRVRQGATS
jgi:hypothetical protein